MDDGVVTRESPHGFDDTVKRLERAIDGLGLTLFARVDHRQGALGSGLDMQPATVLTFGNPRLGTPAMLDRPLAALDLPLRVLAWEAEGRARVSYQEPAYVAARFGIPAHIPARAADVADAALAA